MDVSKTQREENEAVQNKMQLLSAQSTDFFNKGKDCMKEIDRLQVRQNNNH